MDIKEELKFLYSLLKITKKTYLYDDIHKLNTNSIHNNGGTLYLNGNIIYKIYEKGAHYIEEKQRNINFLINHDIPNTPKIYAEINSNKNFRGYTMEYIHGAHTFREGLTDVNITYTEKKEIIKDIYVALRKLHMYNACIGDIHLDNFLYKDGHGYIIDLDELRFPGDEFKFNECYVIRNTKDSSYTKKSSLISDNIKVAISSLSFLYNIDLEKIITNYSLEEVKAKLKEILTKDNYDKIVAVFNMNELNYLDEFLEENIKKGR